MSQSYLISIKIPPPLSTQRVPLGCGVYGDSITLPPYYQAEEKFETSDAFRPLIITTLISGMGLWKPFMRKFPNITPKAIPEILNPLRKMNLNELLHKLETIGEKDVPIGNKQVGPSTWTILIIAICLIIGSLSFILVTIIRSWLKNKIEMNQYICTGIEEAQK